MKNRAVAEHLHSDFVQLGYDGNDSTQRQQYIFFLLRRFSEGVLNLFVLISGGNYEPDNPAILRFIDHLTTIADELEENSRSGTPKSYSQLFLNGVERLRTQLGTAPNGGIPESRLCEWFFVSEILRGLVGAELDLWTSSEELIDITKLDKATIADLTSHSDELEFKCDTAFSIKENASNFAESCGL